jgi:hypothetical protein
MSFLVSTNAVLQRRPERSIWTKAYADFDVCNTIFRSGQSAAKRAQPGCAGLIGSDRRQTLQSCGNRKEGLPWTGNEARGSCSA